MIRTLTPLTEGRGELHLKDIDSQLESGHPYYDPAKTTWAHEGTHGVNSRGRQIYLPKYKVKINSLYMLNGYLAILQEPPTTLNTVAQKVPTEMRGQIYSLYMIQQQRYWNNEPLYILDELTAYTNSVVVGFEYNLNTEFEEQFALEMLGYALTLCRVAEGIEGYDVKPLKAFVNHYCVWHSQYLKPELMRTGRYYLKYEDQYALMKKHYGDYIKTKFGNKTYTTMFPTQKKKLPVLRKVLSTLPIGKF